MEATFRKMHGCGNDFVVLDARTAALGVTPKRAAAIADRHLGIGCDQLIIIETPEEGSGADAFMRIRNPDGSEAGACGNATRCVADVLHRETGHRRQVIRTNAGNLPSEVLEDGRIVVDMGVPGIGWDEVPLARPMDTLHLDLAEGPVSDPAAVSMGNPHATFFVADLDAVPITTIGPRLERAAMFPERANIGFVQVLSRHHISLRVWERGAGLTLACGSGACAAVVNGARRGLTARAVRVDLDGGTLDMTWRESDGHVLMTGPVATAFSGTIDLAAFPP